MGKAALATAAAQAGLLEQPLNQVIVGRRRQHRLDIRLAMGSIEDGRIVWVSADTFRWGRTISHPSANVKRFGHCRLTDSPARTNVALFIHRAVRLLIRRLEGFSPALLRGGFEWPA